MRRASINEGSRLIVLLRHFLDVESNKADARLWKRIEAASRATVLISFCAAHWKGDCAKPDGAQERGFSWSGLSWSGDGRADRPRVLSPKGKR